MQQPPDESRVPNTDATDLSGTRGENHYEPEAFVTIRAMAQDRARSTEPSPTSSFEISIDAVPCRVIDRLTLVVEKARHVDSRPSSG